MNQQKTQGKADNVSDSEDWFDPDTTLWVRHPPRERTGTTEERTQDPLLVAGREAFNEGDPSPFMCHFVASSYRRRFEETGHPYDAIQALRICHAAGLYPPLSVLDWLDSAFNEYLEGIEAGEKPDLVKLLGLAGAGRGQKNPLSVRNTTDASKSRAEVVHILVRLGVNISDAATMTCAREEVNGGSPPKASWVEEDYSKKWRREFENHGFDINVREPPFCEEEFRRSFIESFPKWSRPPGLK